MSELEQQLKQLEMNVAQQFGELDSDDADESDDDNDATNADVRYNGTAAADNVIEEEEDFVLDDSLYCIACKKAFKSDKALVCNTLLCYCLKAFNW